MVEHLQVSRGRSGSLSRNAPDVLNHFAFQRLLGLGADDDQATVFCIAELGDRLAYPQLPMQSGEVILLRLGFEPRRLVLADEQARRTTS